MIFGDSSPENGLPAGAADAVVVAAVRAGVAGVVFAVMSSLEKVFAERRLDKVEERVLRRAREVSTDLDCDLVTSIMVS